ncbi:hypothetical protein [Methyloversatilis sp.]|uniref:hypothetical protein n=1 Tax=Methyloversatilis sp. TaxID=2569862 RepID=UPI003D2A272D
MKMRDDRMDGDRQFDQRHDLHCGRVTGAAGIAPEVDLLEKRAGDEPGSAAPPSGM